MRKENETWGERRGAGDETTALRDQSELLLLQLWNEYEEGRWVSSILLLPAETPVLTEKPPIFLRVRALLTKMDYEVGRNNQDGLLNGPY